MPSQITNAPRQNPISTPAPVETMLDGTGRNTSSASSAPIVAAEAHPDACPSASHVPSCSNCFSKIRNGMMISANINPIRIAQRIPFTFYLLPFTFYLLPCTSFSYCLMSASQEPRAGRPALAQ